jgi:hypothetical protein
LGDSGATLLGFVAATGIVLRERPENGACLKGEKLPDALGKITDSHF